MKVVHVCRFVVTGSFQLHCEYVMHINAIVEIGELVIFIYRCHQKRGEKKKLEFGMEWNEKRREKEGTMSFKPTLGRSYVPFLDVKA